MAEKDLKRRLESDAELVGCPTCRWVNQELIDKYRRARYRSAPWLAVLVLIVGPLVAMIADQFLPENWGKRGPAPAPPTVLMIAACVVAAALILPMRQWLRKRVDPNRGFPDLAPSRPPGTPPPFVEQIDAATGKRFLQSADLLAGDQYQMGSWAILRPARWNFPATCCVCLCDDVLWYPSPFGSKYNLDIGIPLCATCEPRLRRFWRILIGLSIALVMAVSYLITIRLPGVEKPDQLGVAAIIGVLGSLVLWSRLADPICRPFKLRIIDRPRAIFGFKAMNAQYTRCLLNKTAKPTQR